MKKILLMNSLHFAPNPIVFVSSLFLEKFPSAFVYIFVMILKRAKFKLRALWWHVTPVVLAEFSHFLLRNRD